VRAGPRRRPRHRGRHLPPHRPRVAVAGTTELGLIDPIADIARICHARDRSRCHVDARRRLLPPFLRRRAKPIDFDFSSPVSGASASTAQGRHGHHPCGACCCATAPTGNWARALALPQQPTPSHAARDPPGAAAAAAWAVHRHLGRKGFASLTETCLDNAAFLAAKLQQMGVEFGGEPRAGRRHLPRRPPIACARPSRRRAGASTSCRATRASASWLNPHVHKDHLRRFLVRSSRRAWHEGREPRSGFREEGSRPQGAGHAARQAEGGRRAGGARRLA